MSAPAFPTLLPRSSSADFYTIQGITAYQYIAIEAMTSIFTGPGAQMVADRDETYDGNNWAEVVARNACDMAEAMIAEFKNREQ